MDHFVSPDVPIVMRGCIAQHRGCGLHLAFLAAQFEIVGGSVVLKLLAGRKIIAARRHWRCVADAVPPAERRQCLIRHLRACGHQILMDSHEIPLALPEKFQDLLPVRLGLLRTL